MSKNKFIFFKKPLLWLLYACALVLLLTIWTRHGFDSVYIDTDFGRDLKEISNIQAGNIVWLGPWLGPGLHASSSYYYLFFPAVWLSSGRINSLIIWNIVLGLISIGTFGYFATRLYRYQGIIAMVILGCIPLITANILHPGNGFTYIFFVISTLTALWFNLPSWIASLSAGMAISLHPAAGVVLPLLTYELWQNKTWKNSLLNILLFLLPMAPLLIFEVITKGYIIRSFLSRPSTDHFELGFNIGNLAILGNLLNVSSVLLITVCILVGLKIFHQNSFKEKMWFVTSVISLIGTVFFAHLIGRYLFGVALVVVFTVLLTALRYKKSYLALIPFVTILILGSSLFTPPPIANRNATKLEKVADFISSQSLSNSTQKVAVVAALSAGAEVPQADDYRFLLRNRGYDVVEVTAHHEADVLVMIIEDKNFKWENWSNYEVDSFGLKKIQTIQNVDDVTIVTFSKQ